MKEKRVTKKAILASLLSVVVCSSMLIGTSYAWFTDSVASTGNVIKSGTLDIELEVKDDQGEWKAVSGPIYTEQILWEPGYTSWENMRVYNNGNLALKYTLKFDGADLATSELADVIDVYYAPSNVVKPGERPDLSTLAQYKKGTLAEVFDGTVDAIDGHLAAGQGADQAQYATVVLHMQEDAGNEYQNKTLGAFSLTVVATQDTVERDSFDNQYDKDAVYPAVVSTAASLENSITSAPTDGTPVTIKLANDVPDSPGFKIQNGQNVEVDLNDKTASVFKSVGSSNTETQGMQVLKGSSLTVKNGTFGGSNDNPNFVWAIHSYSDLTLENVTIDMTTYTGKGRTHSSYGAVLVVDYGTTVVKGNTNLIAAAPMNWAVQVEDGKGTYYNNDGEATTVIFDETMTGTVDGIIYMSDLANSNPNTKPELIIKGGTFKNTGLTLDAFKEFVPEGYKVTTNGDGSWTVTKA